MPSNTLCDFGVALSSAICLSMVFIAVIGRFLSRVQMRSRMAETTARGLGWVRTTIKMPAALRACENGV